MKSIFLVSFAVLQVEPDYFLLELEIVGEGVSWLGCHHD